MAHPIPESSKTALPKGPPRPLRPIQFDFTRLEKDEARDRTTMQRREAIRNTAKRCWGAYRRYAFDHDELMPASLQGADTFNGWRATLVDSLDTLQIMGLDEEYRDAVKAVAQIEWSQTEAKVCNVFETNIRYLGGLLSAYDLSPEPILLDKAVELGNMLYAAFDTPNHLPVNSLAFGEAIRGGLQASKREASATVGSLSMEFTRLSQLTGDPKYFSVIDRIKSELDRTQNQTRLPGMWPTYINLQDDFAVTETLFTIGAGADSLYEYLGKMYALLGGLDATYEKLHVDAMATIKKHLLFRPMLPDHAPDRTPDILFPGSVNSDGQRVTLHPEIQHLGCFAGAMFALGARLFHREEDVEIGEKLARGCAWAYGVFATGVMPEQASLVSCQTPALGRCAWNETQWQGMGGESGPASLPRGVATVGTPGYRLRPEAIESLFILYRITGKRELQDVAWRMYSSIQQATETRYANSAIVDVRVAGGTEKADSMESFWLAETLKYFYLIFSEPDLISLDDYVLNTEAHPFRIPKPPAKRRDG
ncbi:hypothetical protein P8C59_008012 [Phyllachora maydis]|uniref:alpha-1,2-Mannosidase n=1 Tax=Phyllachora maydis TaxID=1825666 RepID=A0AAD9IBD5_9PEZI|nr:hypothetical protein P8C59_008012 [Phyllachora maydis]